MPQGELEVVEKRIREIENLTPEVLIKRIDALAIKSRKLSEDVILRGGDESLNSIIKFINKIIAENKNNYKCLEKEAMADSNYMLARRMIVDQIKGDIAKCDVALDRIGNYEIENKDLLNRYEEILEQINEIMQQVNSDIEFLIKHSNLIDGNDFQKKLEMLQKYQQNVSAMYLIKKQAGLQIALWIESSGVVKNKIRSFREIFYGMFTYWKGLFIKPPELELAALNTKRLQQEMEEISKLKIAKVKCGREEIKKILEESKKKKKKKFFFF